jgi:glyoxylate/hydroxypyruvate reductase A
MLKVLFSSKPENWPIYRDPLTSAFSDLDMPVDLSKDHPAAEVDYIIFSPNGPVRDFSPFTKAKAVLNLWAGVESIVGNPTLTIPLTRMVDPSLTDGMVEWVTGHVLRHHLGMDQHIHNPDKNWTPIAPPLAPDRKVTILGLGELGCACALSLKSLNFQVTGWSRTPKAIEGVTCLHGDQGLADALKAAEILILLLPLTPETEDVIDATALALLPKGAIVLNPGRGGLIKDVDLLAALESGHVDHATLDAFRVEPLPKDHVFWSHPKVTVTPHIASETRAPSAARVIAENIRRSESGLPLLNRVDPTLGY